MKTIDLVKTHIKGFETKEKAFYLQEFLEKYQDKFNTTPAATKGDYARDGGLVQHIDDMIRWMQMNAKIIPNRYVIPKESMVIAACLHDLYKVSDGKGNSYYIPNILKNGKVSDAKPYKRNECYAWGLGNNMISNKTQPGGDIAFYFSEVAGDVIQNFGLVSGSVVSALAVDLWNLLSKSERNAICYYGMAFNTNKYNLQGKIDPLMILVHSADMLTMNTTSEKSE